MRRGCFYVRFTIIGLSVVQFFAGSGGAQVRSMRVNLAYSSISASQAIVRVMKDAGIFQKNGLDASLIFIAGGSAVIQALIAGDVQAAVASGESSILARVRGADTLLLAGLVNIMDFSIIAAPEVKKPQDLKGKKVAVSRYGSSTDFVVRYALQKWGLKPQTDVAILQVGSQPARFAALKAGSVQGTVVGPPANFAAREAGFNEIATPRQLDLVYPNTALVTTASAIARNEELIRRIVKAFVEGIRFFKTEKERSMSSLGAFIALRQRSDQEETYEHYKRIYPDVPYPDLKGVEYVLKELAAKDSTGKGIKPESFVEARYLREVEEKSAAQPSSR